MYSRDTNKGHSNTRQACFLYSNGVRYSKRCSEIGSVQFILKDIFKAYVPKIYRQSPIFSLVTNTQLS